MTDRAAYFKKLMERKSAPSIRGLAKQLAEMRAGEPVDPDDVRVKSSRRTLSRYLSETKERDVSYGMIKELSPLLKVSVASWPPKHPSKLRRLEAELEAVRGEVAQELQPDEGHAPQAEADEAP